MAGPILRIGNHSVAISRADKVLFPDDNITKGDIINYYRRIATRMLPLIRGHPVVMQRFPDGLYREGFYQKETPEYFPDWITRVTVEKERGHITHVVCENAATLVYLANQACITPHLWLSRKDKLQFPDRMIFDLDPEKDFKSACITALRLRKLLQETGLQALLMTTGSRGLHVVVPLDRKNDFETVRSFAQDAARILVKHYPDQLTTEQRLNKREGRLFIDTLRNAYAQTAVAPYALRAKPGAPVATPVRWNEMTKKDFSAQKYTIKNIFRRLESQGDPWPGAFRRGQSLGRPRRRLEELSRLPNLEFLQ